VSGLGFRIHRSEPRVKGSRRRVKGSGHLVEVYLGARV
jgi:hypothetical protein